MTQNPSLQLVPEIMSKLAGMGPAALEAVRRFVLELEIRALSEEIMDEAEELRVAGKLDPAVLDAAVQEHRQRHPYR